MNKRFSSSIINMHRVARALDINSLYLEAEVLDSVLYRLANSDDMKAAGGLYEATMNQKYIQNTALGKGIVTSKPGDGYYGKGVSAPTLGPQFANNMTSEQYLEEFLKWFNNNGHGANLETLSDVTKKNYGKPITQYNKGFGNSFQANGTASPDGSFDIGQGKPPTTYDGPGPGDAGTASPNGSSDVSQVYQNLPTYNVPSP